MKNTAAHTAPLLLERAGAIATLRFNRPEAINAIDVPMANAFLAALESTVLPARKQSPAHD